MIGEQTTEVGWKKRLIQEEVKELREYTDIEFFRTDHWSSWRETQVLSSSVNKGN